jgi:glycosyltransferase involved in cell wall biosynthesis
MKISIVIASAAGGDFLPKCLDSLRDQVRQQDAEVIVVDRCGGETAGRIERDYPFVNVIRTEKNPRLSVPELRMLGVQQASGDIVAIIEEHCMATPQWVETVRSSFQPGDAAIGGPILDNQYDRIQDWVVYFSEYHNYLPPWQDGKRYLLNGANIAYDRKKLLKYKELLSTGYWEVVLHPLLAQDGEFRSISGMGVFHCGPFPYGYYIRQRYLLSRVWGGMQRNQVSMTKRVAYLVSAPLIPFLLLGRIGQRVTKSARYVRQFFMALPLLVPVVSAYVIGEWSGYLIGVGDALEHVE